MPLQYTGAVILILIIAFVIDRIFRRAIIPAIRKVTAKTGSTWDDYLLSDSVLDNLCRLIIPISVYELIPFALPEGGILDLAMKLCQVYIIVAFVKLICAFISSLYEMFSGHEKTKDHSLKSFYQMLKLVDSAVSLLRSKHKHGETYYWILYYSFLSPQEHKNAEEIINLLRTHIADISYRTYYRRRKDAIEALSSILWGYTSKEVSGLLEMFFPVETEH